MGVAVGPKTRADGRSRRSAPRVIIDSHVIIQKGQGAHENSPHPAPSPTTIACPRPPGCAGRLPMALRVGQPAARAGTIAPATRSVGTLAQPPRRLSTPRAVRPARLTPPGGDSEWGRCPGTKPDNGRGHILPGGA